MKLPYPKDMGKDEENRTTFVATTIYMAIGGRALKKGFLGHLYDKTDKINFADFLEKLHHERTDPTRPLTAVLDN